LLDQNLSTRRAKSRSDTPRRAALVFRALVGAAFTRPNYRREWA
jgi:hypothetical protein